jgi:hemin uptake protein HemP
MHARINTPPASHLPEPQAPVPIAATSTRTQSAVDSAALLQGGKSVTISHNGELYRLQATRQGKLILTK